MSPIVQLLGESVAQRLGLTLVHFIWQGAALALVAVVALAGLRRARAAVRYVVLLALFGAMLCCPVGTFMLTGGPPAVGPTAMAQPVPAVAAHGESDTGRADMLRSGEGPAARVDTPAAGPLGWRLRLAATWQWLASRLAWVTALWLAGVVFLSARLLVGWGRLVHSTRGGQTVGDARWQGALTDLAARIKVSRPVRLLQCATAKAPVVLGWLRPVILVPPSAVAGLTPDQLEAVLAHELAHIRRGDYLVNLAQTMAETLLFYHPAVWWLSARIRMEREHCCDDLAVAAIGDRVGYARTLAMLEEFRGQTVQPVISWGGGTLLARVRRLITPLPSNHRSIPSAVAAAAVLMVAAALVAGLRLSARAAERDPRPAMARSAAAVATQDRADTTPGPGIARGPVISPHPQVQSTVADDPVAGETSAEAGAAPTGARVITSIDVEGNAHIATDEILEVIRHHVGEAEGRLDSVERRVTVGREAGEVVLTLAAVDRGAPRTSPAARGSEQYTVRFVMFEAKRLPGNTAGADIWTHVPKGKELPPLSPDIGAFLAKVKALRPGYDISIPISGAFTCWEDEPGEAEFHGTGGNGDTMVMKAKATILPPPSDVPDLRRALISFTLAQASGASEGQLRVVQRARIHTLVGMDATNSLTTNGDAAIIIFSPVPGGLWTDPLVPDVPVKGP